MSEVEPNTPIANEGTAMEPARPLSPEAQRALAEAAERRAAADSAAATRAAEVGGRGGLEPVRYGDWEKGGIAWDF
jgi:hypothetical protein